MIRSWFLCIVLVAATVSDSASAKICWGAKIYNSSHPVQDKRSDIEPLPTVNDLRKICPEADKTLTAQCRDDKGEPFHGTQNRTCAKGYLVVSCDAIVGLNCTPYTDDCTCPDFSVKYGCDCPVTTTGTILNQNKTHTGHSGSSEQTGKGGNGNGGSVTSSSFVVQAGLVLITFMLHF